MTQPTTKLSTPDYYHRTINGADIQVFDVCSAWLADQPGINSHHLSSAIEYILRAPHKGQFEQDIKKAITHLQRAITCQNSK